MPHLLGLNRSVSITIGGAEERNPLGRWVLLDTPADVIAAIRLGRAIDITLRGQVNCIYFPYVGHAQEFIARLNTESSKVKREMEIYEGLLPKSTFKDFKPRKNGHM